MDNREGGGKKQRGELTDGNLKLAEKTGKTRKEARTRIGKEAVFGDSSLHHCYDAIGGEGERARFLTSERGDGREKWEAPGKQRDKLVKPEEAGS